MAKGAAATISANRSASRIARTAKPRTNRVKTQNAVLRIPGPYDRTSAGLLNFRRSTV